MRRLPDMIEKELKTCGLPWSIETGGRHFKIVIAGRMVGILPMGKNMRKERDMRQTLNVRAQIRRACKDETGGPV